MLQVWRQKEAALQSSDLTRILLSNSAHEVRTPLNAIINYLEIALEGALDQETRDNLTKSHSASKSLIYVINDLLDLTKIEEGNDLIKDEVFNLCVAIRDATEPFEGDAKRKGIEYQVTEHPGLPQWVHGDERRVRQAVSNITANAMQNTTEGFVRIEIWMQKQYENRAHVEIVVHDSGCGMSSERLDALFRDLEQVTVDGDSAKKVPILDASGAIEGTRARKERTLGLGLATVSRIVRNMDGQLRVKSEEGVGSRFVMQLPFVISVDDARRAKQDSLNSNFSVPATPPPQGPEGELTLVERPSSLRADGSGRRISMDDASSLNSIRTMSSGKSNKSEKSDVDRLIDAISGAVGMDTANKSDHQLFRPDSRDNTPSRASERAGSQRPSSLKRARSYGSADLRNPYEGPPGAHYVTGQKTLLTAVRMPEEYPESVPKEEPAPLPEARRQKVVFDVSDKKPERISQRKSSVSKPRVIRNADNLQVLVAEDDPINSKIIQKRLERLGHKVHKTVNGEDCASAYEEKAAFFDVVLMDMQVCFANFNLENSG